jgi:pyruvate dehydrogenase complex dehydrogenase (E1) component
VVLAVLAALARTGELEASVADAAVYELGLDPEAIAPVLA